MNFIPQKINRITIKIGSSTLTNDKGKLDAANMRLLCADIARLHRAGKDIVLVSSGAIVSGSETLKLQKPKSIPEKQAVAAIGQTLLMHEYQAIFANYSINVGQILLTADDLADRKRFINIFNTLRTLLNYRVLPIINENDSVATEEIKVGDNDILSALVAGLIEADLLVILTDTQGLYQQDNLIDVVNSITPDIEKLADERWGRGRGGMATKIQAAKIAADSGIHTVIAYGRKRGVITSLCEGKKVGTLFLAKTEKLEKRKFWITHGLSPAGSIYIDDGAKEVLLKNGKSLLPVGVKKIEGDFEVGDCVKIISQDGQEIARGLTNYSARETEKIKGTKSTEIEKILGYKNADELIHRDNLVILEPL